MKKDGAVNGLRVLFDASFNLHLDMLELSRSVGFVLLSLFGLKIDSLVWVA